MNNAKLLNRIETNPKVMMGKPIVKNSRLTVEIILEKLANGQTENEILDAYPFLQKEDIRACLLYAAKVISLEHLIAA